MVTLCNRQQPVEQFLLPRPKDFALSFPLRKILQPRTPIGEIDRGKVRVMLLQALKTQ
jgi:hypothetical protein